MSTVLLMEVISEGLAVLLVEELGNGGWSCSWLGAGARGGFCLMAGSGSERWIRWLSFESN